MYYPANANLSKIGSRLEHPGGLLWGVGIPPPLAYLKVELAGSDFKITDIATVSTFLEFGC